MENYMFDHPILFQQLPSINFIDILTVLLVASFAYFLAFNNFEKHVPFKKRIIKLIVVVSILAIIGILFGRYIYWSMITLMTLGQIYLHAWYFPKHGINGLTAEPYDKYLEVIEQMKGNK